MSGYVSGRGACVLVLTSVRDFPLATQPAGNPLQSNSAVTY